MLVPFPERASAGRPYIEPLPVRNDLNDLNGLNVLNKFLDVQFLRPVIVMARARGGARRKYLVDGGKFVGR